MRRSFTLAMLATAVAGLAAGCGGDASSSPTTASSVPSVSGSYPAQGIRFTPPDGWSVAQGSGSLVATVQAGSSTVAVWRFARSERLPKSKAELKAARDGLLAVSRKHDRTFDEIKTAPTTVAGNPAVQIRARETIAGQPRTVRSTHIYADGSEIVVQAYSEAGTFRKVDADVFRPLLRSLQIKRPGSA
jgi:hypothetical protein